MPKKPNPSTKSASRILDEIPVIDLFAGPGGLGEGFASAGFDVALSCEMDPVACETLRLRKFYHLFPQNKVPEEYYDVIKGNLKPLDLENSHEALFEEANRRVMEVELGNDATRREVHKRIRQSLNQYKKGKDFVLVGGPPCQAYSLAGRSRRLGGHPLDDNGHRKSSDMLTAQDIETIENRQKLFFDDPKHILYLEYLEIIALHRPAVFVMENVKGMTSAKYIDSTGDAKGTIFERILSDLKAPGKALADKRQVKELADEFELDPTTQYRLTTMSHESISSVLKETNPRSGKDFVLRSENYGVPQTRHRVFVVGVRSDLIGRPERLSPKSFVTVRDIIEKMPKLRSGLSKHKDKDNSENWANEIEREYVNRLKDDVPKNLKLEEYVKRIKKNVGSLDRGSKFVPEIDLEYLETDAVELMRWLKDDRLKGVVQHETRSHMSSDLARYLYCSAYALNSVDKKSPKIEDWHTDKLKPDHANVRKGKPSGNGPRLKASAHSDRFKVQVWHKPSTTVVSHISKDGHYFIHPDPVQCRSLTVREAARLQTFPDNYFFCGNRTQQYHQVGNAVPPYLALQIATSVCDYISGVIETREIASVKRIA